MSRVPYESDGDGVRLAVRVTPRPGRNAFAGVVEDAAGRSALAIRLAAPPVEGAANKALVTFLAGQLGVAKSAIGIVSGETSRVKIVRIAGLDVGELSRRLGEPSGGAP